MVSVIDRLLLKIRRRYRFSDAQENALREAMGELASFGPDDILVEEGRSVSFSSLIVEGLTCRTKYLPEGQRQIMEIDIPGDFVDLHSYPLEWLDHNVTALTPCTIVKLPHEKITALIANDQRLGRIFWFSTMVDASIHREWLVSVANRDALQRIAHLFCEMFYRFRVVDLTEDHSYPFPLRQVDLAEALGLTSVHVNRTLKVLGERKLATFQSKRVVIHDLARLEEVAAFDPSYLFLEPRLS